MTLVTNAGRAAAKRRAVKRSGGGNGSANLKTARLDPTRTGTMRRALIAEMRRRFARLKAAIVKLVVDKDAFGADRAKALTTNAGRWYGQPDREKVRLFAEWLRKQMGQIVAGKSARDILKRYALEGMKKGAGRAFDDVRAKERALTGESKERLDFYNGTREQFLRESFRQPVSVQRVEALAGRSFDDLENITTDTSARMGRTLMDGLVQGKGAEELARDLADEVDVGRTRAEVIARTEIIRAHAEGQLQAMDEMGVAEVGVAVEWATAQDEKVCSRCAAMEGVVLKISEAHGMIPRHVGCRCAFLPAGLGEDGANQIDTKRGIMAALEEAGEGEDWGPDVAISRDRPEGIFNAEELTLAAFCPTGPGGGIDPSCPPSSGGDKPLPALEAGIIKGSEKTHELLAKIGLSGDSKVAALVKANWEKLPEDVRTTISAGKATAFAGWTASQALAEQIAKEKGLTDEQAAQVRGALAAADLALFKPAAPVAAAVAGPVGAAASWIVPPATGAYLLYSTATSPVKTAKAAGKLVKSVLKKIKHKLHGDGPFVSNVDTPLIVQALEAHDYDDWYFALLASALDEGLDQEDAVRVADAAYEEQSTENSDNLLFNWCDEYGGEG